MNIVWQFDVGLGTLLALGTWLLPLPRLLSIAGGILLVTVGASIYVAAVVVFRSLSRLSGPDSSRLITNGIYRWSRNPQQVGWMIFLIGIALLCTSGMVLLLSALFWIGFRMYLPLEEQLLERIYGREYRTYRAQTHRYFGLRISGSIRFLLCG